MDQKLIDVAHVADLTWAHGSIGSERRLVSEQSIADFEHNLAVVTRPFTNAMLADCGDSRIILSFADGTDDPTTIRKRVVPQLLGGIGLATTKAAVAANVVAIHDAPDITSAYLIINKILDSLDYQDAGHGSCAASRDAESAVALDLEQQTNINAVGLIDPTVFHDQRAFNMNSDTKKQRLESGFYSGWTATFHEEFLATRFPKNFAQLAVDPNDHVAHGHKASGIYAITAENSGFAKNEMAYLFDQFAFAVTVPLMRKLANLIGTTTEERARMLCAFADDTIRVASGIVVPDMPVFA